MFTNGTNLLSRVQTFISQCVAGSGDEVAFNQLALEVFGFQFQGVPIYRSFCERRGSRPGSIAEWTRIPVLPVAAFKEHNVSSLPENDRPRVFHSSGTTGHAPSRHYHNAASLALYEASLLPWFERHFIDAAFTSGGGRFLFFTPRPERTPHSSLVHMFETVDRKFGGADAVFAGQLQSDGAWTVDFDQVRLVLRDCVSRRRPVALLGTAFSFVHLLDHLTVNKIQLQLPPGSRIMETGGYKGRSRAVAPDELRRLMTRLLGVPESHIISEYGMSELSSQAYDGVVGQTGKDARFFQFPPWVRVQVISPETGAVTAPGETGLLRLFDLANIHSVMALQTEDLAVTRADGVELLGRAAAAERRGCSLMAADIR
jgi:hypothetical protein